MEYLLYAAESDHEFYIRIGGNPLDGGRFASDEDALKAAEVDDLGPRYTNEELAEMAAEEGEHWPSEQEIVDAWAEGIALVGGACNLFGRYRFVGMRCGVLVFAHH